MSIGTKLFGGTKATPAPQKNTITPATTSPKPAQPVSKVTAAASQSATPQPQKTSGPISSVSCDQVLSEVKKAMDEKDEARQANICVALVRLGDGCLTRLMEIILDKSLDFYTRRFALKIASGFRGERLFEFVRSKCIAGQNKGDLSRAEGTDQESHAKMALFVTGEEILNTPDFFECYIAKAATEIATTPTAAAPQPSPQPVSPPRADQTPKPQPAPAASHIQLENGDGWFFAEDKSRRLRQVVFTFRGQRITPSQFKSTFTFPGQFKQLFYGQSPFATGFFRTDRDPGPFLLVRSWGTFPTGEEMIDSFTEFRIALTFIQMPTSGLVVVFISSDSLQKYSQRGYLECFYGLDEAFTRDLLADVIRGECLYAALDGDSGFKYDVKICMDDQCRLVLAREWSRISAYHSGIQMPDYNKATQSAFSLFANKVDPILSR